MGSTQGVGVCSLVLALRVFVVAVIVAALVVFVV
jgi:hypothetical protein